MSECVFKTVAVEPVGERRTFIYDHGTRLPVTDEHQTRRTVLKGVGTLAAGAVGTTTAAASSATESESSIQDQQRATQTESRSGFYGGTVDRIVDGQHVVLLIESGGETVDQVVVDHERVPQASEGDSATVWLHNGEVIFVFVR